MAKNEKYAGRSYTRIPETSKEGMAYILNNIDNLSKYDPKLEGVKTESDLVRAAIEQLGEDKKEIIDRYKQNNYGQ